MASSSSSHIPSLAVAERYVNHYDGRHRSWQTVLYDVCICLLDVLFSIFFREIKVRGGHNVPPVGQPTILVCAPHANQFIDPAMVMVRTRRLFAASSSKQQRQQRQRQPCFVTAQSSLKKKSIGLFGKATGAIPVPRAQDCLKLFSPDVVIYAPDLANNPTLIKGRILSSSSYSGPIFDGMKPKSLIGLPDYLGNAVIAEVKDNTTLILQTPFKPTNYNKQIAEKINDLLTRGTVFKYAPKLDNSEVYQNVFNHLHTDGCVGIFPEGGSHDRPSLLPIKAGVAIMALGATAADPDLTVSIVPVGLNYFHREKFRSRAVIEYGTPIVVTGEMGQQYRKDPRTAVSKLLRTIRDSLFAITENAPDYETLMTIQAARRLYQPILFNKKRKLSLSLVTQINRNLLQGYSKFQNDPKIINLKQMVQDYNTKLYSLGLKDHQVAKLTTSSGVLRSFPILIQRSLQLLFLTILSLPGSVLFAPVFILGKYYSQKMAAKGLAHSFVKIKGTDLLATWKLLIALFVAPFLYITYSITVIWLSNRYSFIWSPTHYVILNFFFYYAILVAATYSSLKTGEIGMDLFKSLRPLVISLFYPDDKIRDLQATRSTLSKEITQVCNEFGPKVFPEFDALFDKINSTQDDAGSESETASTRSRSSSIVSDGLSRVNSRGSLTDVPIFSDVRHLSSDFIHPMDRKSTNEEEEESYEIIPEQESKITSRIRSRREKDADKDN